MVIMNKQKSPLLAGIMNFILPGAGYIYVGVRIRFAVLLLAATVLLVFAPSNGNGEEFASMNELVELALLEFQNPQTVVIYIATFLMAFAFAYDAVQEAYAHNEKVALEADEDSE